jgi:hypothetical protein
MQNKFLFTLCTFFLILSSCKKKDNVPSPPTANAGLARVIQLPDNAVTLSGSGKDADGSIVSYLWSKVSGPGTPVIVSANSASTVINNFTKGQYIFKLTVTDDEGLTGSDTISVTVLSAFNKVPTAEAGNSVEITLPTNTATLSGSGTDSDGTITAYLWSQVSGPSVSIISNPGSASTQISSLSEGKYIFQLMVSDNEGAVGVDTTSILVKPNPIKTLTLQPGPTEGQDARPSARQGCSGIDNSANINFPDVDLAICAWTFSANGCSTGQYRSFLKFTGLSAIPQSATILSAKLSLYGVASSLSSPQGNSYYPGSPYNSYGTNECWLKRVTGDWSESTITWNNQPAVTDANRIAIPASTLQWGYNVTDIDVTEMVKGMVNIANANHGFSLMHQVEEYYRSMTFASSDHADATKRPKLVVTYKE